MKLKYDETWKGHKLVYQTLGVPQEAVTIYGMVRDIPIDDFKDKNGQILNNKARTIDDSDIADWTKLHERGDYNPDAWCPMTFKINVQNEKENLTGKSSLKGKDGAVNVVVDGVEIDNTVIDGVHLEFHDFDGISALEWEEIAASNENRPIDERDDVIKNDRKTEDTVGTLKGWWRRGTMSLHKTDKKTGEKTPTDYYVNKRLTLLKVKKSKWPGIRKKLYEDLKLNLGLILRTVSNNETEEKKFKDEVKEINPGKKILFQVMDTGASIKYGIELTRKVLDAYHSGKPYDMVVFRILEVTSIKSLTNGRKRHKKYFTDKEGSFQKDKERFKSDLPKDITWPTIKFEPQREDEIISWNKKKVLVDVK